jgi:hypothetical protein
MFGTDAPAPARRFPDELCGSGHRPSSTIPSALFNRAGSGVVSHAATAWR